MAISGVEVRETLVIATLPRIGQKCFVKLSEPNRPACLVEETRLVVEAVPDHIRRYDFFSDFHIGARASFVVRQLKEPPYRVDLLEFKGRYCVRIDDLPVGLVAGVDLIPVYARVNRLSVWASWKLPPRKKWIVIPRKGSH